jgi:hypothetical protein
MEEEGRVDEQGLARSKRREEEADRRREGEEMQVGRGDGWIVCRVRVDGL